MKVKVTMTESPRVLTQDEAFTLIRALEQTTWYGTRSPQQVKGIEVGPDAPL